MSNSKLVTSVILVCIILFLNACKKDDDDTVAVDTDTSSHIFKSSLMNSNNLLESISIVNTRLTDGTSADCYKLVFKSNPVADGPYCPKTINDIGGLGIYDGASNSGFQVMKAELWNAMEADGYDIVDADGNINIQDPEAGGGSGSPACLEASPNNDLQLTFFIPAIPKLASSNDEIDLVEHLGVSKDGIPITGHPPSVVDGPPMPGGGAMGGNIPSIDPCGGHIDPFGYYHLHFGAEEMNNVLSAYNITEVSCTVFAQSETAFIGFAKDGYPIYASKDQGGILPTDLDECQGHTSATADYPDGVYHYHVSSTKAPNLPPCIKGISAQNAFVYE
jgi:hypothetical protein